MHAKLWINTVTLNYKHLNLEDASYADYIIYCIAATVEKSTNITLGFMASAHSMYQTMSADNFNLEEV